MTTWEYRIVEQFKDWVSPGNYDPVVPLNRLGLEGWELVTISPTCVAFFKRPVAAA